MVYHFTADGENYEAFASGGVLYGLPGHPPFPVRLASEIFQRCRAYHPDRSAPLSLYDPCCGGAYHLSALGLMHGAQISRIAASDLDPDALALAARNLRLLYLPGLDQRIAELARMTADYGKDSHRRALRHARGFREKLLRLPPGHSIETRVFEADATVPDAIRAGLPEGGVDLVITDIPYGRHSQWLGAGSETPVHHMLEALRGVLARNAVIAVASEKGEHIEHEAYQRLKRIKLGRRQVVFLRLEAA